MEGLDWDLGQLRATLFVTTRDPLQQWHQQLTREVVEVLSDDDDDDVVDDGGVGPSTPSTAIPIAQDSDDDEVEFIRETAPRSSAGPSSASASSRWRSVTLLESTLREAFASRRGGSSLSSSSRSSSSHHRRHHSRSPSQGRTRQPSATRRIVEMLAGTIERSGEQQRRLLQQQEQILRQIQERRDMLVIQQRQLGGWLEANGAEGYHVRYNNNNNRRIFEPNGQGHHTTTNNNNNNDININDNNNNNQNDHNNRNNNNNNNNNNPTQQNPFYNNAPIWPEMPFPVNHPAFAFFPDLDYHFLPDLPPAPPHPAPAPNATSSASSRSRPLKTARPGYTRTLDAEQPLACPKCLKDFDVNKEDSKNDGKEMKVSMIVGCGHIVCGDCAEAIFLFKKPLKKARALSKKGKQKATPASALGKRRRSTDVTQEASVVDAATSGVGGVGPAQGESLLSDEDKDHEWTKRATGPCPACNRRIKPKAVVQLYV
ncbi:hypothetical protein DFQ27_007772 [Actinomortierella ambigua]|uniref:RING-type domain-containing protein n=1 Tax=Actinomortierella ambigua TaxID=1343610 RepID=A0A9P6QJH3_9FUNG|nr:hypothetical protein DFQ27_007772 [Actinomortierella ambigua]